MKFYEYLVLIFVALIGFIYFICKTIVLIGLPIAILLYIFG